MKKLLTVVTISLASLTAFAQGKILFATDSLHLAYWGLSWLSAPFAGQGVTATNAAGFFPVADLYMGTSSSTLYLYTSTTFGSAPGKWNQVSVTANANPTTGAPAIPGGTTVFVVAQIHDGHYAAPNIWSPGSYFPFGDFYAVSQEFTFALGSGIIYPPMYNSPTWAVGTYNLDQYGIGSRGAIDIPYIPEPSTFALAGLGAAAVLLFRRRK
jgi:PEP-CTERM motif